jgi:hypothetical protein
MEKATSCLRCGKLCQSRGPGNADARLLRRAESGYCPDCAATEFLLGVDTLREMLDLRGPAVLRKSHYQAQFARILASGHSDAAPGEIDWERVIANWDLPFPAARRRTP